MNNILIIEPSSAGLELLPAADSMMFRIFVFTANKDERVIPSRYLKYINNIIEIDTYDVSKLFASIQKINHIHPLSAIIPGSEYHVPIAAQLASLMHLPGVDPQHVNNLRIKSKTRDCLKEKGIRCPRYAVINNENEITAASKYIGFPCVLKPIASAGSMHVSRINTYKELRQAYRAMRADTWAELGQGIGNTALIEEYIDGEEFSVEGFIEDSRAQVISITKKFLTPEPYFIEMGHIVPSNTSPAIQASIESYTQSVISALSINLGIFHAELRVDKQGPVLMEIAGRLPGCRICDLILFSKEINMYKIMIQSHLGLPINVIPKKQKQYAGMRYFKLDGKDFFNQVNGIEELQVIPGFQEFNLLKQPGEYVPPLTTFLGRVATCIFTAPTYDELTCRLDKAISVISFS